MKKLVITLVISLFLLTFTACTSTPGVERGERPLDASKYEPFLLFENGKIDCTSSKALNQLPGYSYQYPTRFLEYNGHLFHIGSNTKVALDWSYHCDIKQIDRVNDIYLFIRSSKTSSLPHTLSCVAGGEKFLISEYVEPFSDTLISRNGETILYVDTDLDIHLFDIKTQTDTKTRIKYGSDRIALSPDGKTIAYVTKENVLFLYSNGTSRSQGITIDNFSELISVNSDGSIVYYTKYSDKEKTSNSLFVLSSGKEKELFHNGQFKYIMSDYDYSSIIFTANKHYYISANGGNGIHIPSAIYCLTPEKSVDFSTGFPYSFKESNVYVDSFANKFFVSSLEDGDSLYYMDENYNMSKKPLVSNCSSFKLSDDGKLIYYIKNNNLYHMETDNFSSSSLLATDVAQYSIASESSFAYVDTSKRLYKGTNDGVTMISQKVNDFMFSDDGVLFYYTCGITGNQDKLYRVDAQNNSILVSDNCDLSIAQDDAFNQKLNTVCYLEILDKYTYEDYCPECGEYAHAVDATLYQMYFLDNGTHFSEGFQFTETN